MAPMDSISLRGFVALDSCHTASGCGILDNLSDQLYELPLIAELSPATFEVILHKQ